MILNCIKQNVTDKKKAKKLIQMLTERLDIVSLCYIPLNCRIVLYVYQQQDTLPDTLTQLYEVFILYTLKHYKNKIIKLDHEIDNDQIEHANTIKKLPTQVIKCLDCLSETAFTGMTQDKLVFEYTEVRGTLSLGLLNLIKCTGVLEDHYQFLHLTIQEFLAARHLALTKSNKDKLEFITSKIDDDRFRMTLLFLSGLTQLDFLPIEQAFPASKSIHTRVEHKHKNKTKSLRKQERSHFLFLAHLQYESRQTTHNWLLPCLVTNSLNLSEQSLSQFNCLVLANFLALTPKDHVWDEINLSQCGLNYDCFKTLITKKHSQRDIPVLCLTKQLDVTFTKINADDLHVLMPLLSEESKVNSISISHHESCTQLEGARKLINLHFRQHSTDNQTVLSSREMRVPTDSICSGILTKFINFIRPEVLKRLSLVGPKAFEDCPDCSGSGNEAWESVCNVIKNSKRIQHLQIHKSQFHLHDITTLMIHLQNKRNLRTLQLPGNTISHDGLIHLRNNLPVNVRAHISTSDTVKLVMSVHKDKLVYVDIESPDEYIQDVDSEDLFMPFMPLLEEDLPSELHGVTVTTKSFVSKALLRSIGNSKTVTSLTLANLSNENLTKCAGEFQDMLMNTNSLQTLKLDTCELNDTFIKQLEDGLSLNPTVTVALKLEYNHSHCKDSSWLNQLLTVRSQNLCELILMNKENMRQLSEIVTTCKQLRVLKVNLSDNSESFFHALSDNQSLRELSIETTGKMTTLLFQTLPSTSVTTLDLSKPSNSEGLEIEGSLAFKEYMYIHGRKVLTVLRVTDFGLTEEAFKGITFTKDSPLRELSLKSNYKGWTELFNGLCSSCITTLDVSGDSLNGEECGTALKRLLINNKTLTVLKIVCPYDTNDDVILCIADALSQNSLKKLTISTQSNRFVVHDTWTKLFESFHKNTTLNTLNYSGADLKSWEKDKVAKSLCEMLIHNQGLQNLNIDDKLIKGHLKEFATVYIQRKPVLNLTVGQLEDDLVKEIEGLETDTDKEYNIRNRY
ncbi:uncharacterized protein LOC135350518 [Halichondria panicea]|uniref:uncharacterized protein LOC135350518 n=1 Tax=Halichondria panicea TaxID=6063 RepID=UPI00312B439A